MLRLLSILFVYLCLTIAGHAQVIPPNCTPTSCPGSILLPGAPVASGNQFTSGGGTPERLACADFFGSPGDGSAAQLRQMGYNCEKIRWRDAFYNSSAPTFTDNFNSAQPWLGHEVWQSGDPFSYAGTNFHTGVAQGPTWWCNPIDNTVCAPVYTNTGGTLNLSLIQNPGGSGIPTAGCTPSPCGTLGALINNQQTPGGSVQLFGYHEFQISVPNTPNFLTQWDIECLPATCNDSGMEIDVILYTDNSGTQHVVLQSQAAGQGNIIWFQTTMNLTGNNIFGVNWQSNFITFFINGTQVAQVATPSGEFQTASAFAYFLTSDARYFGFTNNAFSAASATAKLTYYHVFQNLPSAGLPATGCNSSSQMLGCVNDAAAQNLRVIFEHTGNENLATTNPCFYGPQSNGLPYDLGGISNSTDGCGNNGTISEAQFQQDWVNLATQFAGNSNVIGAIVHHEPALYSTARQTTGVSTGSFSINSTGQIIDPNGAVFIARGLNLTIELANDNNVSVARLQALFPRVNYVRITNFLGGGYTDGITPQSISAWVKTLTDKGIVVQFSDYPGNNSTPEGTCRQASGTLPAAAAWYAGWAAFYKSNPYVWGETQNECFDFTGGSISQNEIQTNYNAMRNAGFTAPIGIGSAGGSLDQQNGAWYFSNTLFAPMVNVFFDVHPYPGSYTGIAQNQPAYNAHLISQIQAYNVWHTNSEPLVPVISGEIGNCGNTNNCPPPESGAVLTVQAAGDPSVNTGIASTGSSGVGYWEWNCGCDGFNIDTIATTTGPPYSLTAMGSQVQGIIVLMPGTGPTPGGGGTGGTPIPLTWGGGGTNNSDILQVCNQVGAAIHAVNAAWIIGCPGPVNGTPPGASGTGNLLSGVVKPIDCNNIGDLSLAATQPFNGVPLAQVFYAVDFLPRSVNGPGCVDTGSTLAADLNAYWGSLIINNVAPVMVGAGCSCDGSNGAQTDDNNYGSSFVLNYLNGSLAGGPTFLTTQEPISTSWESWFFPASTGSGQNPNGILMGDNATWNINQQQWGYSLLMQPVSSLPTTAWNPGDKLNTFLSNGNKTATSTSTGNAAARSTQSRTSGNLCEEFQLTSITANQTVGIANANYLLNSAAGLGRDQNSIGIDVNSGTDAQSAFYNSNTLTSLPGVPSSAGEKVDVCENFTTQLLYFTTSAMRANLGANAWNNSNSCSPTVTGCGLPFSGLTGPWLLAFSEIGPVESPAGSAVPSTDNTLNASATPGSAGSGSLITISPAGKVAVNGVEIANTGNVIQEYYTGNAAGANGATAHSAYQENSALNWFGPITSGNGGPNPLPGSPITGTVPPQAVTILNTVGPMAIALPPTYSMWDTATTQPSEMIAVTLQ